MSLSALADSLDAWVLATSGAWWVLPVIAACCLVDAVFPLVPSESLLVALASLWAGRGPFPLIALALVGAIGAFLGDQIAFRIGRLVGSRRFRWMRRPRIAHAFDLAERQLERRGATLIFTARYIPVGRVAVNITAGATGFSARAFAFYDGLGCLLWGSYSVGIGLLGGHWMQDHRIIGVGVSVLIAVILGWALDQLIQRVLLRRRAHEHTDRLPVVEQDRDADAEHRLDTHGTERHRPGRT